MQNPKYIDAAGIRTRYFEAGQGDPLFLVHDSTYGEPSNAENWEPCFAMLAKHFHVYAMDKLGQGYTDNPKSDADYVIGTSVKHIADFAKALGLKKVHAAGHSRGGYVVCRLALDYPDLVDNLIVVDSGTMMGNDGIFYERLETQLDDLNDAETHYRYMERVHSRRGDHITDAWIKGLVDIYNLPKMRQAMDKMGWGRFSGGGTIHRVRTEIGRNYFKELVARRAETHQWIRDRRLKSPTLIVWGYNDPSASVDGIGTPLRDLILPNVPRSAMHIINEAGHHCYREQPADFTKIVTTFIKG